MARNIFSQALTAAAESEGGTQALANILRVPDGTLRRWFSGRAMMPVLAFSRLLDIVAEHENRTQDEPLADGADATLTFELNHLAARCASCQGTVFVQCAPGLKLRYSAVLACKSCGTKIVHRALLVDLAMLHARQNGDTRMRRAGTSRRPPARADSRSTPSRLSPLSEG